MSDISLLTRYAGCGTGSTGDQLLPSRQVRCLKGACSCEVRTSAPHPRSSVGSDRTESRNADVRKCSRAAPVPMHWGQNQRPLPRQERHHTGHSPCGSTTCSGQFSRPAQPPHGRQHPRKGPETRGLHGMQNALARGGQHSGGISAHQGQREGMTEPAVPQLTHTDNDYADCNGGQHDPLPAVYELRKCSRTSFSPGRGAGATAPLPLQVRHRVFPAPPQVPHALSSTSLGLKGFPRLVCTGVTCFLGRCTAADATKTAVPHAANSAGCIIQRWPCRD